MTKVSKLKGGGGQEDRGADGQDLVLPANAVTLLAMEEIGRIALAFLGGMVALVAVNILGGLVLGLVAGLAVGVLLWGALGRRNPILRGALIGAGWCGIIGFAAGFFGPMLLMPESNQGPMFGLFISGPGGVVLGAMAGAAIAAGRPG